MKYPEPYRKAVAMQRQLAADCLAEDCDRKLRPQIAKAYVELEHLKLRLRMKPAPKPVDVSKAHRSTSVEARFSE